MPEGYGLVAEGLWFRYGTGGPWVVKGAGLRVGRGEVVGLRGPSGCGKTTLARILAGYLIPDAGLVRVDGRALPRRGASPVQLVLQHPELAVNPRWRLGRILAEGGADDPSLREELSIAPGWLGRFPHELSGGELQRIAVARALLARPAYVVADEISAMLDPLTQAQLWHALLRRVRSGELGVVAVSHDDALLEQVTDRVVDMAGALSPTSARIDTSVRPG